MSKTLDAFLEKQMENPIFKAEYDALEPEYAIIHAMIEARNKSGLTQKELSERTGINQGDISRIERGSANPSLNTLKKLAEGMNMTLQLVFSPAESTQHAVIRKS